MTLGLDGWLEKLANKKIPVLKHRRDQMLEILHDEKHSLSQCLPVLLSDPLMTAQLFRRMNQQRVKDRRLPITTASSLLSLFGSSRLIQELKAMVCIEDLGLPEENLHGIEKCLKQGWYCTWFAMKWTTDRGVKEPEEIHVASVMQSVPELMLWCYGGDALPQLGHRAYCECKTYYLEVPNVLGCHKRQIGQKLAEQWELPELVGFAFETEFNAYTHATAIGLAALLARICQHGWYGSDMAFFHEKSTHYFGELENRAAMHLHRQLLELVDEEIELGYRPVASMLLFTDDKKYPEAEYCLKSLQQDQETPGQVKGTEKPGSVEAVSAAAVVDQKQFAADIDGFKALVKEQAGFNDILKKTVLTLHKTLHFQRVAFLMVTPDQTLINKLNLHADNDDRLKQFKVDLRNKGLFKQLLAKPQAFCLNRRNFEKFWPAVPGAVKSLTQSESFCMVSIFSAEKPIGMIYADNAGADIDPDLFKAFQQMTMMLNKALTLLKKNK